MTYRPPDTSHSYECDNEKCNTILKVQTANVPKGWFELHRTSNGTPGEGWHFCSLACVGEFSIRQTN